MVAATSSGPARGGGGGGAGGVVARGPRRPPPPPAKRGEGGAPRRGVGHTGARGGRRHTRGAERGERLRRLGLVLGARVVEGDRRARARERLGGGAPDAARAAGDQHAPAGEAHAPSPARATSAATCPLAHTSRTRSAPSRGAAASAASR